jgi:flagellar protein FlaJ
MLEKLFVILGNFGARHLMRWFGPMKEQMTKSNLAILFEMYVGRMMTFALLSFLFSLISVALLFIFFGYAVAYSLLSGLIAGATAGLIIITMFQTYPYHILSGRRKSLETNHPFAINHMAAIAESGVPPFIIFKLMANVSEYGEVAHECKRVTRNVETFGMDMISAIRNVAERTSSLDFKQFLYGLISTIDTGGDMRTYLANSAKDAIFDYRIKRERYMQTLSTYADFYTAVLIAAPLFFVSVLSIMSLIGGEIFGLNITTLMNIGIFLLIPVLNTAFIIFIHYSQPSI